MAKTPAPHPLPEMHPTNPLPQVKDHRNEASILRSASVHLVVLGMVNSFFLNTTITRLAGSPVLLPFRDPNDRPGNPSCHALKPCSWATGYAYLNEDQKHALLAEVYRMAIIVVDELKADADGAVEWETVSKNQFRRYAYQQSQYHYNALPGMVK